MLVSSLFVTAACAAFEKKQDFADRFDLINRIGALNAESISTLTNRREQILENLGNQDLDNEAYTVFSDELFSLEHYLTKVPGYLKTALDHYKNEDFYANGKNGTNSDPIGASYYFLRDTVVEIDKLRLLQEILFENELTLEGWNKLAKIVEEIRIRTLTTRSEVIPEKFKEPQFFKELANAVKSIDSIPTLQEGDTLVGIGNTPQFIIEAYRTIGERHLNIIQVALSSWPGLEKKGSVRWLDPILTPQGLENYHLYMDKIGLSSKMNHQRVFFLDYIGGGGGPEFLMQEFIKTYDSLDKVPDIYVIAINKLKNPTLFEGTDIDVDAYSLDMEWLSNALDRVDHTDFLRTTPDFPSWRWHNWGINLTQLPVGKGACQLNEMISKKLRKSQLQIDSSLKNQGLSVDEIPLGIEPDTWERRFGYYSELDKEAKFFFDTHFDLVNLYSEENIEQARVLFQSVFDTSEQERFLDSLNILTAVHKNDPDWIGLLSHHLRSQLN
jgi:hypothetical protein